MSRNKQKLVIKPKSIQVAQTFDAPFPTSEQSVFSNGYDWLRERSRLEATANGDTQTKTFTSRVFVGQNISVNNEKTSQIGQLLQHS